MRLLIFAALLFLAWRALKSWLPGGDAGRRPTGDSPPEAVEEAMVKDPQCGVYFARHDGVHLRFKGEDRYFCSAECRDRFVKEAEGDRG